METNENSFTLKMATDGPVETQAPFSNAEVMDTTPADETMPLNNEESVKKMSEPEIVEKEELTNEVMETKENEHAVNNKEEMNCDEEEHVQSDSILNSPSKSQLNNSGPVQNDTEEKVDSVTSGEVKDDTDSGKPHDVQPDQSDEMEQDNKGHTVEEPPEPDSTPAPASDNAETDVVSNDVQHSEDETKVEEVSASEDNQHDDKVEENTAEPVVEEPQDAEMKEEVDGQAEEDNKDKTDRKQQVEISDVTDKEEDKEEEEVHEEKKTDEELLIDHINTAYQCLDDFMKTKDEIKIKDCMDLLTEIKTLTVKTVDSLKVFTAEQKVKGHSSKKSKRSKSSTKATKGSSRSEKNDVGHDSDSPDPFEEVNLKDIKGLAVFAKWPNSGWFYPGVVRDLALADLKGNQNLTVTFYDGLERDMKSINIFPAELIPASSVLFDLDEETDLTVGSIEREENWVKYVLTMAGEGQQVTKDFDKMAIKGAHMKSIKQAVDSLANKSENIVTGRRARGKSSMFNEDYVSSSSPRSTEKRKSKVVEDSKSTPVKAPAKRKSSSKDDESGDSTPSRSASKRRQVNGTKSLPRRAAKK